MLTLTYGFKKPETNDKGNEFFPALEENIQQLNDHTHNGSDSPLLPTVSLVKSTQSILSAAWAATSGGRYRQEVTLPAGFTYANTQLRFVIAGGGTDGEMIYPSIVKGTAANKYYVYINDNSLALTALYV
jgi:hypothetical protein